MKIKNEKIKKIEMKEGVQYVIPYNLINPNRLISSLQEIQAMKLIIAELIPEKIMDMNVIEIIARYV